MNKVALGVVCGDLLEGVVTEPVYLWYLDILGLVLSGTRTLGFDPNVPSKAVRRHFMAPPQLL